jgi:predicted PurR-regulated permease PerM
MLHSVGLDNPAAWAVVAALLHIIPYFGSLIAAITIGFAAFLQFESFSMMLLLAAATLTIATFVGIVIATWMTGRIAKMNATAVFVALLFGAWLWGVWGMLLCVPIIVVVKVISQHVEGLQSVAELLSE